MQKAKTKSVSSKTSKKSAVMRNNTDANHDLSSSSPLSHESNVNSASSSNKSKPLSREISIQHVICNLVRRFDYTSNPQIASELSLSIPTAIAYSKDLLDRNILVTDGKCPSTGGKRASKLVFNPNYAISIGVDLRQSGFTMMALDFGCKVVASELIKYKFVYSEEYFKEVALKISEFCQKHLSIYPKEAINPYFGVSVPGIVVPPDSLHSHALKLNNKDFSILDKLTEMKMLLINDSNAGALAETFTYKNQSFIYLSLSKTVGSGIVEQGKLVHGQHDRAGEVGHMTLVPFGRLCYCGQEGCVDPYLNEFALLNGEDYDLKHFFEICKSKLEGHDKCEISILSAESPELLRLERYLKHLAILINNINNAFDTKIILGGKIGSYLYDYLDIINSFFLKRSVYPCSDVILPSTIKTHPSAFGAAYTARDRLIDAI